MRQAELSAIQARIATGLETARKLPEFRAQVGDLESRLESLKAILPEEKDVADLLRRIQTMASQSNLTIRTFRPQAMAQKELHAEWPIGLELDGTYPRRRPVPRQGQQVPPDHQRRVNHDDLDPVAVGDGQRAGQLHRHDLRPDRQGHHGSARASRAGEEDGMTPLRIALVVATLAVAAHVAAQAPPAGASTPPPAPATPPKDLPTPPANFEYRPEGRRDPFLNLSRSGSVAALPAAETRPTGAAGLLVDELSVRGIVRSQGAYVAMVSGPTGQTFTVRGGQQAVRWHGADDRAGCRGDPAAGR